MYELCIGRPVKFRRPIALDGFSEAQIGQALMMMVTAWNDLRPGSQIGAAAIVTQDGRTVAAVEAGGQRLWAGAAEGPGH
jgi:hypothetical protein